MGKGLSRKRLITLLVGVGLISLVVVLLPWGLAECFYQVGRIHTRRLDPGRAADAYSSAIRIRPHASMYLGRADSLHTLGRFGEAIRDYDEALRLGAARLPVVEGRGNSKLLFGDVDGAIDDWSVAIELAPSDWGNFYGRGIARFRKGDARGALDDYTKALALDSRFHLIFSHRAEARMALGDYDGAIEDATSCLKKNGSVVDAYVVRGRAWEAKGVLDAALRDYSAAMNRVTLNVMPYLHRCDLYVRQGKFHEALQDADELVRLHPQLPDGYFARGRVLAASGDRVRAITDYQKSLSRAPQGWVHQEAVQRLIRELKP